MQAVKGKGYARAKWGLNEFSYSNDFPSILDSQKHEVNVYTNPTVPSLNPPQSKQRCLFGKSLTSLFEDKKLPTPILVSIILGFYSTFVLSKLFNQTD